MIQFFRLNNLNYVPSSHVFYRELARHEGKELAITDPGNCTLDVIREKIQSADIVVLDLSLLIALGENELYPIDYYIINRKPVSFYQEVWELILGSAVPLFIFSPSSDLNARNFGLPRELFLRLLKRSSGIFWPYYRCPVEPGTIPEQYNSILPRLGMQDTDLKGIWAEVVNTIPVNIDLPHCLAPAEMLRKNRTKKWDIIVPGAGYKTRQIALESVKESGLRVTPFEQIRRWKVVAPFQLYKRVFPVSVHVKWHQSHSFRVYQNLISRTAATFTCGSELKYFVRKFLEVPAFRSVMIAYPSDNLRDYGFEDGIHYLRTLPEETAGNTRYVLANPQKAEAMVEKAWNLVATEHIASTRVNQVLECLKRFQKGKLKEAGYYNGRFEMLN